jgi:3-hydroxymyristoyl/3-hydroxydecanoyl-(acyl carrier protein) dehydratase
MTWETARLRFDGAHPTAAGHFPGNPMIPGAMLLDEVIVAIAGADCDARLVIRSAKFLHIVRPGEDFELRWQKLPDGGVKFECRVAEMLAVTGRMEMAA